MVVITAGTPTFTVKKALVSPTMTAAPSPASTPIGTEKPTSRTSFAAETALRLTTRPLTSDFARNHQLHHAHRNQRRKRHGAQDRDDGRRVQHGGVAGVQEADHEDAEQDDSRFLPGNQGAQENP